MLFKDLIFKFSNNFFLLSFNWPVTQPIYLWSYEITPFFYSIRFPNVFLSVVFLLNRLHGSINFLKLNWMRTRLALIRFPPNTIQVVYLSFMSAAQPHYWTHRIHLMGYSANLYSLVHQSNDVNQTAVIHIYLHYTYNTIWTMQCWQR